MGETALVGAREGAEPVGTREELEPVAVVEGAEPVGSTSASWSLGGTFGWKKYQKHQVKVKDICPQLDQVDLDHH